MTLVVISKLSEQNPSNANYVTILMGNYVTILIGISTFTGDNWDWTQANPGAIILARKAKD